MTSIKAIRAGLATRLETIAGLRVEEKLTATINPPAAIIYPAPGNFVTYDQSVDGVDDVTMIITLLVSRVVDRLAQDKLDDYIADAGQSSIKAAIDGDPTLGGAAHDASLTTAGNYGPIPFGEGDKTIPYFGCDFTVVVGAM
jgi:hypothetical protein